MQLHFTKMSGAGNDFVVIDNRKNIITDGALLAKKLCDRRWGIGADGLLLIEKSEKAHYRMMYYNADGSYGGMCRNGGRCVALYSAQNGIAPREQTFEALDHVYKAVVMNTQVILQMKDPKNIISNIVLPIGKKRIRASFIDTGSPHVVLLAKSLANRKTNFERLPLEKIGRVIRDHKRFKPNGTNVNFVDIAGVNQLNIRTYERGVEAETSACGTGSVASAIMASLLWKLRPPIRVFTKSKRELIVDFDSDRYSARNVTLEGPAEIIFEGKVVI